MTLLSELSKSVTEMSDDELLARVRALRISRAATPPPTPKRTARSPAALDVGSLDAEAAAGLLELLEGLCDD